MAFNEYSTFDGLALGRMVRECKVTPAELMDAAISCAEKHNAKLNAIVFKDYDRARAAALAHKAGAPPFAGVPLLLKDIMGDWAGMPTRSACAFVPATPMTADSEVVARYKRAGFIPFAKTNAPELGIPPVTESRLYGPAHNPWNIERTPGGSSGGSAAAVAEGIVPVALATTVALDSNPRGVLRIGRPQANARTYLARAESRRRPRRLRGRARIEQKRSRQRGGTRRDRGSDAR